MFKDFDRESRLAATLNRNAALRNVTYASYAILNGMDSYSKLPWITDKPEMYESALRRIAYCNIGKMPEQTTTSTAWLKKVADDWKDILFKQIDLYDPDVIIVCGTDTLQVLNGDMGLDLSNPKRTVKQGKSVVDIHSWRGKRLIWAPHPAAHLPPQDWVNSVIKAVP